MIKKIEYENKVSIQNDESVAEKNKVTDANMNEIKEVINNNADELEQAQKDIQTNTESIAQIKEKNTTQDSLIEELQAENTKLKKEINSMQIPGEATGNPIHLSDSSDMECEIVPIGGEGQETREGYNLLIPPATQTKNGVTFTVNDDNSITVNGTAEADASINFVTPSGSIKLSFEAGTYKLTGCPEGGSDTTYSLGMNLNTGTVYDTGNGASTTLNTDMSNRNVWLIVKAGTTVSNLTFYPMLIKGTEDKPYEPYGAMPSPDYPSEIVTVGQNGSVEIEVCNKNYFDVTKRADVAGQNAIYGLGASSYTKLENGYRFSNRYVSIGFIFDNLKIDKEYIISFIINANNINTSAEFKYGLNIYQNSKANVKIGPSAYNIGTNVITNKKLSYKFICKDKRNIIAFGLYSTSDLSGIIVDITDIQLESGSEVTDYIPHQSYTKVLPIQQEMLDEDYIDDVEYHEWGKVIFNGDEEWKGNWQNSAQKNSKSFVLPKSFFGEDLPDFSTAELAICSHFQDVKMTVWGFDYNCIALNSDENLSLQIRLTKDTLQYEDDVSTEQLVSLFKTLLKSQYDAGTPVTLYYKLAEPKELELTAEQSAILNSFYTYKGITNISVDGIATLKVNYKKDLETLFNNINSALLS